MSSEHEMLLGAGALQRWRSNEEIEDGRAQLRDGNHAFWGQIGALLVLSSVFAIMIALTECVGGPLRTAIVQAGL